MVFKVPLLPSIFLSLFLAGCTPPLNLAKKEPPAKPKVPIGDAKTYREWGAAYINIGQYDEAIKNLNTALELLLNLIVNT